MARDFAELQKLLQEAEAQATRQIDQSILDCFHARLRAKREAGFIGHPTNWVKFTVDATSREAV